MDARLIDLICRRERRASLLPPDAACSTCGDADPFFLILSRRPILCATCAARARGRSGFEWHHLGGRPSPFPPVLVTINEHRLLTLAQEVSWRGVVEPGTGLAVFADVVWLCELMEER